MSAADEIALERETFWRAFAPGFVDEACHRGELAMVAAGYLTRAGGRIDRVKEISPLGGWVFVPRGWPIHHAWWQPLRDPRRNLVRGLAAGLIELDRLDRANPPKIRSAS